MALSKQYGAAMAFAMEQFGGLITEVDSSVTVAATGITQLVVGNGDRVALILINLGSVDVMVSPESSATTVSGTVGIRLAASGGGISMNLREDLTLPSRRWNATPVSANSGTVYVLEQNRNVGTP